MQRQRDAMRFCGKHRTWLLLAIAFAAPAWPREPTAYSSDAVLDIRQQTRQQRLEQGQLNEERRLEQTQLRPDAHSNERVLELREQQRQQGLEQRRLHAEKRLEQSVDRLDAVPKDRLIDLREQLRQQYREQRALGRDRRGEDAANRPPVSAVPVPAPATTDLQYDQPR